MFGKFGVCLSGGGGKGAYQIGVWQALRDQGLDQKIAVVSGTSVGGQGNRIYPLGSSPSSEAR